MERIPREPGLDNTLALMRDPYGYIGRRCRRHGSDVFQARLLGRPTLCMTGRDAAELFYEEQKFKRAGAAPGRVQKTLFGRGGVQTLDGQTHRSRKAMFMQITAEPRVAALVDITGRWWRELAQHRWAHEDSIVLYRETQELLTRAVCEWAGIPLDAGEIATRTNQLTAMFDAAGAIGPRYWRARLARQRGNAWARRLIDAVRRGRLSPGNDTALHQVAHHRDPDGQTLSPHAAAVELLNVLRPTVAVSVYITLAATALHEHPEAAPQLAEQPDDASLFVQEVRRFYPFFPMLTAITRHRFTWRGYDFPEGRRTLLDLYGTNHDPRLWDRPDRFEPERFRGRDPGAFALIPQGGGDANHTHRCPGEDIAIDLTRLALRMLTQRISYDLPDQDLRIDAQRLPALPRSRVVLRNIRWRDGF